jgi:hypothetical protein
MAAKRAVKIFRHPFASITLFGGKADIDQPLFIDLDL